MAHVETMHGDNGWRIVLKSLGAKPSWLTEKEEMARKLGPYSSPHCSKVLSHGHDLPGADMEWHGA